MVLVLRLFNAAVVLNVFYRIESSARCGFKMLNRRIQKKILWSFNSRLNIDQKSTT
jgi:hypothetical protein